MCYRHLLMPGACGDRNTSLRFGAFELNIRTGELRKRGIRLQLSDQAVCILRALLDTPAEVVTREHLRNILWPNRTFVDSDSAINKLVSQLRTVLGDSGLTPRFIETLSRRGYRFVAPVSGGTVGIADRKTSIAVLPFRNLTGDPANEYIAEGFVESLTTGLGGRSGVRVISGTSARASAADRKSLAAIGSELQVAKVVEGSIIGTAPFRVNARIVDIQSDCVLWHGKYNCEPDNLLMVCDKLTETVAAEISGVTVPRVMPARRLPLNRTAYLTYLKGRYFWSKRTEQDLYRSIQEFQSALAAAPDFALAHAGLGDAYILLGIWGLEPSGSVFPMARRAAERAIELDDSLAEAHNCLAEVMKDYVWDWHAAETGYQRAIALNPNYSTAHHFYAQLLISMRRFADAVEQIELARRVDPLSRAINAYVPYIYFAQRDYAMAVEEGQRAVEMEPSSPVARWHYGRACLFAGDGVRAVAELETASELGNRRTMWQGLLSFARARTGDREGAEAILNELVTLAQRCYVSPYDLALCCAGLGQADTALDYLEQAYEGRVMRIISLGDPEFDGLRQEPRFVSVVDRLGLPS